MNKIRKLDSQIVSFDVSSSLEYSAVIITWSYFMLLSPTLMSYIQSKPVLHTFIISLHIFSVVRDEVIKSSSSNEAE